MSFQANGTQNTRTIRPYRKFEGHTRWVNGVIHLPDGKRIMTCSNDGSLRVWNLESGEQIGKNLRDGEHEMNIIALSPDGKKVVSGSKDGTVWLWDIERGKVSTKWVDRIGSVYWNRDTGQVVTMVSQSNWIIRVRDVENGKTILGPTETGLSDSATVRAVLVICSADTTMIVTGAHGDESQRINVWDARTGKLVTNLDGHTSWVNCLALTADQGTIISGSFDNSIRMWNTTTWEQSAALTEHSGAVDVIAISPNGRIFASASADHTVRLWDLENRQPISSPLQHPKPVNCVSFSTDGKLLATGCCDYNAYTWDVSAILREAGLDEFLSNPDASTSQNPASQSVLNANATRRPVKALNGTQSRIPQGFFNDPRDHIHSFSTRRRPPSSAARPSSASRPTFLSRFSSLLRRPRTSVREATIQNRPSTFSPLVWTRALFTRQQLRQDLSTTELEQRPPVVEVPYTRGLARNAMVRRKPKKKAPTPNNIMPINVGTASQPPNGGSPEQQLSGTTLVQQSLPQPQELPIAMPAAVTTASITQPSDGAPYTQQSSQSQAPLTTPLAGAAPIATTTTSITGTPLHPDLVIRQPGCWTRFHLFLCCVSAEVADNHH